jgi:hypothetical protein
LKRALIWKIFKKGYLPPNQRTGDVGPGTSRPSNGREVPNLFQGPSRGSLREYETFLIREETLDAAAEVSREVRGPYSAEGHPARWTGGRFPSPYISPYLPPKFSFYSAKTRKKKEGEKAAKPYSHVGFEIYSRSSRIIT